MAAKIRQHGWKERLHIHKVAKFENDLMKTREDLAPQSRRILQMFVLRGGGGGRSSIMKISIKRLFARITLF